MNQSWGWYVLIHMMSNRGTAGALDTFPMQRHLACHSPKTPQLSSAKNLCLNLEMPTLAAKACFTALAGLPSNSSASRTVSTRPELRNTHPLLQ